MDEKALSETAANIKLVVFDVDGVLTDGKLVLGENGNEYKSFHVRDGHGIVMLMETGCNVAVITARSSKIVAERMSSLGIKYIYQGEKDKGKAIKNLFDQLGLMPSEIAYVGDDIIDLPAMNKVALPIAVADAHPEVRKIAKFITKNNGGQGAAREVCELIMIAQDNFKKIIESYLIT
ncbi:MAG: 3-deoxy-manno-octulosonate-8-phosphatase KdsC [Legionellales bacterium]|nr:3-deoxy-manno-octulosonate-8-phosphatase KdsC [Legionellales bacterium]|tara:strand:- start:1229 stop:1762 length:534 start_codon:yes stop_codon:yes gene_type:complete